MVDAGYGDELEQRRETRQLNSAQARRRRKAQLARIGALG